MATKVQLRVSSFLPLYFVRCTLYLIRACAVVLQLLQPLPLCSTPLSVCIAYTTLPYRTHQYTHFCVPWKRGNRLIPTDPQPPLLFPSTQRSLNTLTHWGIHSRKSLWDRFHLTQGLGLPRFHPRHFHLDSLLPTSRAPKKPSTIEIDTQRTCLASRQLRMSSFDKPQEQLLPPWRQQQQRSLPARQTTITTGG